MGIGEIMMGLGLGLELRMDYIGGGDNGFRVVGLGRK